MTSSRVAADGAAVRTRLEVMEPVPTPEHIMRT